jgi:hypothetical protein
MTTFTYILIPCRNDQDLEERSITVGDEDEPEGKEVAAFFGRDASVKLTLLIRPTAGRVPGLYAYSTSHSTPNIRATRLAMACGHLPLRFRGDIILFRHFHTSLSLSDIKGAACVSPDLRASIQQQLGNTTLIPPWLTQAAQQNYHDTAALKEFAQVMTAKNPEQENTAETDQCQNGNADEDSDEDDEDTAEVGSENDNDEPRHFVAKDPLCLHCRRPSNVLCPDCHGCYFCESPRTCRADSWSHDCVCATWKLYSERRSLLKEFPFNNWHLQLLTRENELSEEPCRQFLEDHLGLSGSESSSSWWRTETGGWAGGQSSSAKMVDPSVRRSYEDGFAPIVEIPPQRRPSPDEAAGFKVNDMGLLQILTWTDYYQLRQIPLSSPVALLLTFPLTIYHAIATLGEVPVTVARMLKRPLRVHLVGVEKELNFLDIFQELGYLLPEDLEVSSYGRLSRY